MLENHNMLVPFDLRDGAVCRLLKNTGLFLVDKLQLLFDSGKRRDSLESTWKAFQYECALEKLLWGRCLCVSSNIYSVNLGPGRDFPSRSLTDFLGFLALENALDSTSEELPPPLQIWHFNQAVSRDIKLVFGFLDYLSSSNSVLGERAILILLQELVDEGKFLRRAGEVIAALGNNIIPFWATDRGKLNLDSCVSMLTKPCRKKHPFGVVLQLMSDKGKDITDIMTTGIRSLGLCFFPVVKTFDKSKHAYLSWNGVDLLHIDISTQETSDENSLCEFLTAEILLGLIQKKLIYRSKLLSIQQKRGFIFPWVKPVIVKLKGIKLSTEERASVLLFVTAVAFLQNHWYVNFEAMSRLLKKLPLTQIDLKLVQIQCRYLLKSYPGFHIFRHHESIPCRLNILEKKASIPDNCLFERFKSNQTVHNDDVSANEHEDPSNEPENTITESGLGLGDVVEVVETVPIRHLPSGYKIKWSSNELEVLHEIEDTMRGKPLREKYRHYQQLCVKKSIPDLTYNAFKIKLRKIINSFSGFNKLFVVVYSTVTNWPSGLKRHIKLPADRA